MVTHPFTLLLLSYDGR